MTFGTIAEYASIALAVALVLRLLSLRLHTVYRVFSAYVLLEALSSVVVLVEYSIHNAHLDYRLTWIVFSVGSWVLTLWMVYALLEALLTTLPGILRLSRRLLNFVFIGVLIAALFTARPEYLASRLATSSDLIDRVMAGAFVAERIIFMSALLILLAMLAFILWFPVRMPRNLAVFSIGFIAYFATMTSLLLANTHASRATHILLSEVQQAVVLASYVYWLLLINRRGETVPVRIGHSWGPDEQQRLIGQLEAMNEALIRARRRQI